MTKDPARDYLRLAASSATAVGLVIVLYDIALDSIHRAIHALKANHIEQRTEELNCALAALGQLQGSLDMERGGEVARQLDHFYSLARAKVLEAQLKSSEEILRSLATDLLSLREAWQMVEQSVAGLPEPSQTDSNDLVAPFADQSEEETNKAHWRA